MNRNQLVDRVAGKTGFSKSAISKCISAYEAEIKNSIANREDVYLHGFMRIERTLRKPRNAYDFNNHRPMLLDEKVVLKFTPGAGLENALEESVNKKPF